MNNFFFSFTGINRARSLKIVKNESPKSLSINIFIQFKIGFKFPFRYNKAHSIKECLNKNHVDGFSMQTKKKNKEKYHITTRKLLIQCINSFLV